MFHSIRWRLVASYVLLTLISVSAFGVLASEIVRRNVQEQELKDLQANAGSLAQQLFPLMSVRGDSIQIHSLTQAASFLGDVRVRVIDDEGRVLSDSGRPTIREELVLVYPPGFPENFPIQNEAWFNLIMPAMEGSFFEFDPTGIENLPHSSQFQFIQRSTGPWGGRISFEIPDIPGAILPTQFMPEAIDMTRSEKVIREPIGNSRNPLGYVEVSEGQDIGTATIVATQRAFLLAGAGATLLAVIFGLVMSQRLTSPLRSLQETARKMGAAARRRFERPGPYCWTGPAASKLRLPPRFPPAQETPGTHWRPKGTL